MTGSEFEQRACELFASRGFWALNIPKNKFGAQPFDVIAIKDSEIWAVDCKVCSEPRLSLARVETNQALAFGMMTQRTNARCGFLCYHNKRLYFIPWSAIDMSKSSIKLTPNLRIIF